MTAAEVTVLLLLMIGCAPFSIIHSVTSWPSQIVEMTGTLKILFGLVCADAITGRIISTIHS